MENISISERVLRTMLSIYERTSEKKKRISIYKAGIDAGLSSGYASAIFQVLTKMNLVYADRRGADWNMEMSMPNPGMADVVTEKMRGVYRAYNEKKTRKIEKSPQTISDAEKKDICLFTDQELVNELRNRGWNVTATKSI